VAIFDVFDGEPGPIFALKTETKSDFEKGIRHYFSGEFANASESFKKVLEIHAEDKTARLYLGRSEKFILEGTPENWQGAEVMNAK